MLHKIFHFLPARCLFPLVLLITSVPLLTQTNGATNDGFAPTQWTVIRLAADSTTDPAKAQAALTQLCRTYWPPLYRFVRSRGYSVHDAQDVTQSFFAFLIERKIYARVDRRHGKFRSFLLAALKNFLADHYDREHAHKRGGDREILPLDPAQVEELETSFLAQTGAGQTLTEDRIFEQTWAETLLRDSLAALAQHYEAEGQKHLFQETRIFLTGSAEPLPAYPTLAPQLGMRQSTLRSFVTRLRARYREAMRAEVRRTVARESEVDEELRELLRVLSTP